MNVSSLISYEFHPSPVKLSIDTKYQVRWTTTTTSFSSVYIGSWPTDIFSLSLFHSLFDQRRRFVHSFSLFIGETNMLRQDRPILFALLSFKTKKKHSTSLVLVKSSRTLRQISLFRFSLSLLLSWPKRNYHSIDVEIYFYTIQFTACGRRATERGSVLILLESFKQRNAIHRQWRSPPNAQRVWSTQIERMKGVSYLYLPLSWNAHRSFIDDRCRCTCLSSLFLYDGVH